MAITDQRVSLHPDVVLRVQAQLRVLGIDAWLLFNFRGNNPYASGLLGLPPLTRRYAVLIPADGAPRALTHRIEHQPWDRWTGERHVYHAWRELDTGLARLLAGVGSVAMEYSPADAVPYVDVVPAGVVELVRRSGVEVRSSAELISAFYSRWSAEGEASHRRAAVVLQETARAAFDRIAAGIRRGEQLTEWEVRSWIGSELRSRGLKVAADAIVGVNANAANPHYAPSEEQSSPIRTGDLVLIDLWGKEDDGSVYADQTWMGYVGDVVPERIAGLFSILRDAREAALDLLQSRHAEGRAVRGFEVDDATRDVIVRHGFGDHFIHRTGHSIDRELHGSGPNIDNLETQDTRELISGVGFSIEPGIYLPGDVGLRTEINVFMGPQGPEATTPRRQDTVFALLADLREEGRGKRNCTEQGKGNSSD